MLEVWALAPQSFFFFFQTEKVMNVLKKISLFLTIWNKSSALKFFISFIHSTIFLHIWKRIIYIFYCLPHKSCFFSASDLGPGGLLWFSAPLSLKTAGYDNDFAISFSNFYFLIHIGLRSLSEEQKCFFLSTKFL